MRGARIFSTPPISSLTSSRPLTHPTPRPYQQPLPPKTVFNTRVRAEDNVVSAANKARRMLFYLKRTFAALTPRVFLPLYTPANPWRPKSHGQDYPWSPGVPYGVNFCLSNPPRATRPRIEVPPTAMLYAPSPFRLHHSGCSILEQIAD